MVEDDKADEEADRVVQEVTKVLLDLGVLRKHIDDILEKSHTNVSSAVLHVFILVWNKGSTLETSHMSDECDQCDFHKIMLHMKKHIEDILEKSLTNF